MALLSTNLQSNVGNTKSVDSWPSKMKVKFYLRNLIDNIFRDRARRFATQPVTSEEVDEAKSQISNTSEPSAVPTPNNIGDSGTAHHN